MQKNETGLLPNIIYKNELKKMNSKWINNITVYYIS